jgi:pimeloyl-[acyl-carrier protein] methyl ester esterase
MHWILIRGLARSAGHWGSFATQFDRYVQGTMTCIDLPGFGELNSMSSPASVELISQQVIAQITRQFAHPGDLALLGISMGGMVAMEIAALHPDWVKKLILINTSNRRCGAFYRRLRPAVYPDIFRALLMCKVEDRERVIYRLTSNRHDRCEKTVAAWLQIQQDFPVSARAIVNQLRAASNYSGPRLAPCIDTLIVVSAMDRLVHPDCSLHLAKCWRVPLEIHPSAGHDLPLDDPQWLIHTIDRWLARGSLKAR